MNEFTFCVLTYNHEDFILDTLESIKYQVINYGNNIKVNIIIGNDYSSDETDSIIDFWIRINRNLFHKVDYFCNEKNIGACKTICEIFKRIKTNDFKLIEGDDLFSSINVFKLFEQYQNSNVVSCTSLHFSNYKIINEKKKYVSVLSKALLSKRVIKALTTVSVPFNGTSMWYSTKLINDKMISRLEKYYVIGDRNIWFSLFHDYQLSKIKYEFDERPMILYRFNEFSITSEKSPKKNRYQEDYQKYISSISKEKLSFFESVLYSSFVFSKKHNILFANLLAYINKFLDRFSWIFTSNKIDKLLKIIPREQQYLDYIKKCSEELMEDFYEKE